MFVQGNPFSKLGGRYRRPLDGYGDAGGGGAVRRGWAGSLDGHPCELNLAAELCSIVGPCQAGGKRWEGGSLVMTQC